MYNPVEYRLCIPCVMISSWTKKIQRDGGSAMISKSNHRWRWLDDALFFLPAYEYNDCRDHRGEEHKTAEYSQGDHGSQVQLGLMGTAGLLSAVHSEGTGRFRYARADSRLCVVHAASGYLVILRVIAAAVIEHRRRRHGSVQADARPSRDGLPHRRWEFRGVRYIPRRQGGRTGSRCTCRGPGPRSEVRPYFRSGRTYRRSGRRSQGCSWFLW